jgi:hypothetical protein
MPIEPDDKNWTWVLERRCPECGFDGTAIDHDEVAGLLRENVAEWPELLAHPDAGRRPSDDRWSAVEYACHVRDVFRLYEYRLGLMLDEDGPHFANWDQDQTAIEERYAEQDAAEVATQLVAAGESVVEAFAAVAGGQWERTGFRSDGVAFTVDTFARYFLHDPVHHVVDVRNGYARLQPL